VYLNGRYHGLFVGIDHVDDEFIREMGMDSGQDLYKSVSHDANFYLTNAGGALKSDLAAGWEKKEGLPLTDLHSVQQLTAWSANSDSATFAAELDQWLLHDAWMDWFLLVRRFAADDSAGKNAYLYVDPVDGRFHVVPWDFNHALGQTWQTARQSATDVDDYIWNNGVFNHLQREPTLAATLWAREAWLTEPGNPLSADEITRRIDEQLLSIGPSTERDWDKWRMDYVNYGGWSWRSDWTTPAEEHAYVLQWVAERDQILTP
jgi:spore coat protein CotH